MWLIIVSVESLIAALLTRLRKSSAYISAKWYRSWRERRSSKTCDCPSVSSRSPWQLPALFFFFVNSWKALNFPQVAPPPISLLVRMPLLNQTLWCSAFQEIATTAQEEIKPCDIYLIWLSSLITIDFHSSLWPNLNSRCLLLLLILESVWGLILFVWVAR